MGATYTRQSSYTDGDVITAAHTNDEFDQLLAAFQASTGHTHDGTANEGGPITKLLGNTLTFGAGTAGTDITITFDGETSDGVLKWMEDEDYFEFSDDILVASTEKLQFRDTAIYINSSTDGQLDLVADGAVSIDAGTDIILDVSPDGQFFQSKTPAGQHDKPIITSHMGQSFYPFFENWPKNTMKQVLKFNLPWVARIPKGYKMLQMHPMYQDENRFTTLSGILEPHLGQLIQSIKDFFNVALIFSFDFFI